MTFVRAYWPFLTTWLLLVGLTVCSVVFAGPVSVVEYCPRVACPEPCSPDDCNSAADAECRRLVGEEYFVMHYCKRSEP